MKFTAKHLCYLNIGRYLGAEDPATVAQAYQSGMAVISKQQAAKQSSATAQAAALANQTGGAILGFTYE